MFAGFLDVSLTPQTNMIYLWRHQETSNNPRKSHNIKEQFLWISECWKSKISKMLEKAEADKSWRSVSKFPENLECGINIFQKTRYVFFGNLEYGNNIFENMKWKIGNVGATACNKHEKDSQWAQEWSLHGSANTQKSRYRNQCEKGRCIRPVSSGRPA